MNREDVSTKTKPSDSGIVSDKETVNNLNRECEAIIAADEEQAADIFKLNIDCFEEIFDYLSLDDLRSVTKTCKRLLKVANYHFDQNYASNSKNVFAFSQNDNGKYIFTSNSDCFETECKVQGPQELEFSKKLNIYSILCDLLPCSKHIKLTITFRKLKFTADDIEVMKEVLKRTESITLHDCNLDDKAYETFIRHCKHLKYFNIKGSVVNWHLDRILKYPIPTLECFQLSELTHGLKQLGSFFHMNPSIRRLIVFASLIEFFKSTFINLDHKVDTLEVIFAFNDCVKPCCEILDTLYERQFYKTLSIKCMTIPHTDFDRMATLGGLTTLNYKPHILHNMSNIKLSVFNSLEDFTVYYCSQVDDWKDLPDKLVSLKRVRFICASSNIILHLVSEFKILNTIIISIIFDGAHFDGKVLNLVALNRERRKLDQACAVTIFVTEDIYVATKWAMKRTDFGLVRVKRITLAEGYPFCF